MSKPTGKLIRLTAGDVGAYTKTEADTKIADAKKAGTDANTNANGRVPTSRKVNGKPLTADISLTAGDVSAYTKTEADTKIADAKKAGTDANTNANGRVPTSRKINGKPLTADISLTAGDVSAYTKTETDTKVVDAKKAGTDANTNANGRVPNGRKVNGKPLSADISLTAGDVGALTQTQGDSRYVQKTGNGNGGIGTYKYKQRLIYTITNWSGDFTVTLPESLTGRIIAITNNVHKNSMSLPTLVPADGVEFVVSSVDGNSTMIQASASGTKLKFYGRVYFDPTRIYVWE